MIAISDIRRIIAAHHPRLISGSDKTHAAVALVFHEHPAGLRLLFIERAEREGDPWSGHIAFPGGKVEACDRESRTSAERETLEEIGLDLCPAEYLGRLDDVTTATVSVLVSGFVYGIENPLPLKPNNEVKGAFWIPLNDLPDPKRHTECIFQHRGVKCCFPAIDLLGPGRPVLWGLTYRFVMQLLHLPGYTDT